MTKLASWQLLVFSACVSNSLASIRVTRNMILGILFLLNKEEWLQSGNYRGIFYKQFTWDKGMEVYNFVYTIICQNSMPA